MAHSHFPWGISNQIQSSGTKHVLNSYVDHDNLYGAKVRSKFICVTEGQGAELSNYKVTDFALVVPSIYSSARTELDSYPVCRHHVGMDGRRLRYRELIVDNGLLSGVWS